MNNIFNELKGFLEQTFRKDMNVILKIMKYMRYKNKKNSTKIKIEISTKNLNMNLLFIYPLILLYLQAL